MAVLNFVWDYIVPFLFILTVLVFFHELGHYLVARYNRVRVEVFSIGFGPEIFGWTDKYDTRWKISAIPLGGYVRMFGENDGVDEDGNERVLTPEEEAVSFHHKRLGQRAAVVSAGPIANFLLTIVLLAGLFSTAGIPSQLAAVGTVQPGSAAEAADLRPGDRIVAIDAEEISVFEDLRRIVSAAPDTKLSLSVIRGGNEIKIVATPKPQITKGADGADRVIGLLGVGPDPKQVRYERQNPLTATWMAVERTGQLTTMILGALGEMITGERTAKELGGPVRIAYFSGEVAKGGIINLIFFMAALSLNLGLINLFPIPALDGGHLVYYAFEALLGRPLTQKAQEYGFRFGLGLVLLLVVFATWNDVLFFK